MSDLRESSPNRQPREPCPETDVLIRLYSNVLAEGEADRLHKHVDRCRLCSLLLERLKDSDSATIPEGLWHNAAERLDRGFTREFCVPDRRVSLWPLRSPGLAWIIVALMVWPASIGMHQWLDSPDPGFRPAVSIELDAHRGQGGDSPRLHEADVILSFFIPVKEGKKYAGTLRRDDGATLFQDIPLVPNDTGRFQVVCRRDLLRSGRYVLWVIESDTRPVTPYEFHFRI
jgi:hypothetical protein